DDAGADLGVSMNVDARVQPQHDGYLGTGLVQTEGDLTGDLVEAADLVLVVEHNDANTLSQRIPQLLGCLVVAVEDHVRRRNTGPQPAIDLATRDDIQPDTVTMQDPDDRRREVGLAAVDDPRVRIALRKCAHHPLRPLMERGLIKYVERRA